MNEANVTCAPTFEDYSSENIDNYCYLQFTIIKIRKFFFERV